MKLVLYHALTACSLVSYVNLTEAGAEFETRALNFRKGQNRTPEYLAINPQHKVPTLVIDGVPLTESVAIQYWISRTFPAAGLMPAAEMDRVRAISLMAWFASGIHPHLSRVNNPKKFCDAPQAEAAIRKLAMDMLSANFAIANERLASREYFFERFSVVDAYFYWCVRRALQLGAPMSAFPHCISHSEHMEARPSVRKALAHEQEVAKQFAIG